MTIRYGDTPVNVWKNGDVALAYELIGRGFTEYVINNYGNVLGKAEIRVADVNAPILGNEMTVVVSYIPADGSFSIYRQRCGGEEGVQIFYEDYYSLEMEACRSRQDLEALVISKVNEFLGGRYDEKV